MNRSIRLLRTAGQESGREACSRFLRRGAAAVMLACILVACHRETTDAATIAPAIDEEGAAFFQHHFIDRQPPGGRDCCTDVLALADVDGDGYTDVIVGAEQERGAGLIWYEFPTWQRHEIGRGEFTTDGDALDFDGDGDIDVIVGDTSTGIAWFEQQREGERWLKHSVAPGYTHDLAIADFNGDGLLDVVRTDKKRVDIAYRVESGFRHEEILERGGEGLAVADLDRDDDLDVLFSNAWLENATEQDSESWIPHDLAPRWAIDTRIAVADMNDDGREDVVLSGSEGEAGIAWFESPEDVRSESWRPHPIEGGVLVGAHSLAVADLDLDGDLDIVTAEMHTSPRKRLLIYLQSDARWDRVQLATHGAHNMAAADLDADGDVDLIGKNYGGPGRFIELWENRAADLRSIPGSEARALQPPTGASHWTYEALDPSRPEYDRHTFGLILGDVNSDSAMDLAAGGTLYVQNTEPAKPSSWHFSRIEIAPGSDIIHMTPHRRFGMRSLLAVSEQRLQLLQADALGGTRWAVRNLRQLPSGRTQGYAAGPPDSDGRYEFYFTKGNVLFKVIVPADANGDWQMIRVASGVEEGGVAVADLERDGDLDVVTVDGSGRHLLWLEATPMGRKKHLLGAGLHWFDRVAIADINNDSKLDIIFTEETRDWEYNARVGWLEAPPDVQTDKWKPHVVTTLRSANSLDVTDIEGDGDVDIVVAEHTDMRPGTVAADNFTGVFLNDGAGGWAVEPIEVGPHSSHLGARTADLDANGTIDVVSIGWEQNAVHLWTRTESLNANSQRPLGSN